jgi:hypothetical protein
MPLTISLNEYVIVTEEFGSPKPETVTEYSQPQLAVTLNVSVFAAAGSAHRSTSPTAVMTHLIVFLNINPPLNSRHAGATRVPRPQPYNIGLFAIAAIARGLMTPVKTTLVGAASGFAYLA